MSFGRKLNDEKYCGIARRCLPVILLSLTICLFVGCTCGKSLEQEDDDDHSLLEYYPNDVDINDDANDDNDDDSSDDDSDDDVDDDVDDDINDDGDDDVDDDVNDDVDDDINDDVDDDSDDDTASPDDDLDDDDTWRDIDANECCLTGDPCAFADNGRCECPLFSWDRNDCGECNEDFGLLPRYPPEPPVVINGASIYEYSQGIYYKGLGIAAGDDGTRYIAAPVGQNVYIYSFHRDRGWARERIDRYASIPALAMDSEGALHVAYYAESINETGHGLKYATNKSGRWESEALYPSDYVDHVSIAVDASGHVHICWYDYYNTVYPGALVYANNVSGQWSLEILDATRVYDADIAVSPDGVVHIVYNDGGCDCYYVTNEGGTWSYERQNETRSSNFSAITLDQNGDVHIVHSACLYSYLWQRTFCALSYRHRVNDAWTQEDIPLIEYLTKGSLDLRIDHDGFAHIVHKGYTMEYDEYPAYITNETGQWVEKRFECYPYAGGNNSLSLDRDGAVHWVSDASPGKYILYQTNENGYWESSVIELMRMSSGIGLQMMVDPENHVNLVSWDSLLEAYYRYIFEVDHWERREKIPIPLIHHSSDITIDEEGFFHIAREISDELKYATNRSGEWTDEVIGGECIHPFIETSPTGDIYISCGTDIYHKDNLGAPWDMESLDSLNSNRAPLTIDSFGFAHVLYQRHNGELDDIVYAFQNGDRSWNFEELGYTGDAYTISLDSLGQTHVLFYCDNRSKLVYGVFSAGTWEFSTIVDDENIAGVMSLDENDYPHILFKNNGAVYYATNIHGQWNTVMCEHCSYSVTSMSISQDGTIRNLGVRSNEHVYTVFPIGWTGE